MKSFEESVREILNKYSLGHYSGDQDTAKAILELVRGIVPDRQADSFSEGAWEPEFAQGFNACREQFLERLK